MKYKKGKSMFWGLVLITVGVLLVINYSLGIHLPIFKILFGVLLVYWGISIIFGSFGMNFSISRQERSTNSEAIFAESSFKMNSEDLENNNQEFSVIFGSGELDLSNLNQIPNRPIVFNTVFGEGKILIKKDTPYRVKTSTAFGKTRLPGKNISAFGQFNFNSKNLNDSDLALEIIANTVFGQFEIIEK